MLLTEFSTELKGVNWIQVVSVISPIILAISAVYWKLIVRVSSKDAINKMKFIEIDKEILQMKTDILRICADLEKNRNEHLENLIKVADQNREDHAGIVTKIDKIMDYLLAHKP